MKRATSSTRRSCGPSPASKASSPLATWPTTTTARPLPPPAPAAWPPSMLNDTWLPKVCNFLFLGQLTFYTGHHRLRLLAVPIPQKRHRAGDQRKNNDRDQHDLE